MKKRVKILLDAIILVILIILGVFLFYYFNKKIDYDACMNHYEQEWLVQVKFSKCLSLCPIVSLNSKSNIEQIDPSCKLYCFNEIAGKSAANLNKFNKSSCSKFVKKTDIWEEIFPPSDCYNRLISCFSNDINKEAQNWKTCVDKVFNENCEDYNLSDIKLGLYQKYSISIEELKCINNSIFAKVKINEGAGDLKIRFYGNSERIGDPNSFLEAPKVGETKEYNIDYVSGYKSNENLSTVLVQLIVNNDTLSDFIDEKDC